MTKDTSLTCWQTSAFCDDIGRTGSVSQKKKKNNRLLFGCCSLMHMRLPGVHVTTILHMVLAECIIVTGSEKRALIAPFLFYALGLKGTE